MGSPPEILGCIRFESTLGDITLPVEALILPNLGPDKMLLDNSIMNACGTVLDGATSSLLSKIQDGMVVKRTPINLPPCEFPL